MLIRCLLTVAISVWACATWADTTTESSASAAAISEDQVIDVDAAQDIFRKSCRACHGNKAQGASSYPALADLDPAYIATQLERYRAGEKIGPNSILMISHAKRLSDEDIVNISVYVATAFD
ncbi:c-type cytochrome [uncultured Tateyamaria sp.]|uniref:c-type cytochrome n=1 Tax=uncultured Tateyamaria sp. TaxID=455651 RepID=UPI00260A3EF9|nr:c-type cytochrome [uncultured Tateyamaria sp.]